jgi:energy-coupling factor transport system substrate-specific component
VFGAAAVMLMYGPLVDTASALMFTALPTWAAWTAMLAAGFPFNVVYAAATVVFMVVLANPMIDKLDRIKQKFGLAGPRRRGRSLRIPA